MRTFLLVFATLLVLAGGFALYFWIQDPPAQRQEGRSLADASRAAQRSPTTTQRSVHGIGSGDNPWVKRFEDGELVSMFRSERWEPRGGDVVAVTRPEAEFFSDDGQQRLRIEGQSGEVIVPGGGESQSAPGGGAGFTPPSRGQLHDVRISMYEPADAIEPMLVATMANAVFDNDTFRIATVAYTGPDGRRVEADEVPIIVRGRDYDFTGRGLVIRWNQRDRKLQLLEVAHGESLTVKNVEALSKPRETAADSAPQEILASAEERDVVLAAASEAPARPARRPRRGVRPPPPAPAASGPATRNLAPVVYRATFEKDVNVLEGAVKVATAERLEIDLLQEPAQDPATQPAGEPAPSPAATRPVQRDPARAKAAPATAAAFKGPITVKWTGALRVVPLESSAEMSSLVPGKPVVRLAGSPVVIDRDDMQARCGVASFNSADGSASLRASEVVPIVTMSLAGDTEVKTPSVTYAQAADGKRIATLVGPSTARIDPRDGKGPFTLSWHKDGRLALLDLAGGKTAIELAEFNGDVEIVHPDLDMTGQALALRFDPSRALKSAAATAPAEDDVADSLREIVASGDVTCRLTETGKDAQQIAAQSLRVELDQTPGGETYARLVQAKGDVRTMQGKDELRAGLLTAELAPATQPAPAPVQTVDASGAAHAVDPLRGGNAQLVSLVARDAVKLSTADGSAAAADLLKVETVNGRREYRLEGAPATVAQDKTTISGPSIRFAPEEQVAEVIGAGGMTGTLPDDPKESFDIRWGGGAEVNGATNLIEVKQQVVIQSKQADGTINTATSDRLQARLERKPATQPTAAAPAAATSPSQGGEMNFLAGKELTQATLFATTDKLVEVKSELFAADGALLRGLHLYAATVTTDRRTGRLEVPVPGKMLYQDHRPPEEKKQGDSDEGPTLGSGRGNTAFLWNRSLIYDDSTRRVTMSGDVEVVHHPETKDGQPFNLWADTLTAQLEADPAVQPGGPAGGQSKMRLKQVTAAGSVKVESTRLNVDARELSYDPLAGVLHARGEAGSPIIVFDKEKGTTTSAGELEWNTKTDQFRVKELRGKVNP